MFVFPICYLRGLCRISQFCSQLQLPASRIAFYRHFDKKTKSILSTSVFIYILEQASYKVWTINTDQSAIKNIIYYHFLLHTDTGEQALKNMDCMPKIQYESGFAHVCTLYWPHYTNTPLKTVWPNGYFCLCTSNGCGQRHYVWGCTLYIVHRNVQYVCLRIALREFILKDDFIKMWFQRSKSLWTG